MTNYNQRSKSKFGGHDKEMFRAVCADCKKSCEVPFKPNGMKPVYCRDCFAKNGGQVTTNHFSSKPFAQAPSHSFSAPIKHQDNPRKSDEQTKLLETLNAKVDTLIALAEKFLLKGELTTSISTALASAEPVEKKAKKVVAKKK